MNQAAYMYQLQQNLGGGLKLDPPRGLILTRGRGRQDEVEGGQPQPPGNSNTVPKEALLVD